MNNEEERNDLDRDQHHHNRMAHIQHKVDSIDQTLGFMMRADEDKYYAVVKRIFGKSRRLAQIYLAVDGKKGVQEIADHLGMHRQHAGQDLKALAEEGLLEIIEVQGNKHIYTKKTIERNLQISRFLQGEFNLKPDGLTDD
jgi:DNA-binding transcriptional ArsR family regulator